MTEEEYKYRSERAWATAIAVVFVALILGVCTIITTRVLHSAPAVCQKVKVKVQVAKP